MQRRNLYPEISHITGVQDHLEKEHFQKGDFKQFFKQHTCHHKQEKLNSALRDPSTVTTAGAAMG